MTEQKEKQHNDLQLDWPGWVKSLLFLVGFWAVAAVGIYLDVIPWVLLDRLGNSTRPLLTVFFAGGVISTGVIIFFRLTDIGIDGIFGKVVGSEKLRAYVVSLPIGLVWFLFGISALVVVWTTPYCQNPSGVKIRINDEVFSAGNTYHASPNESFTVQAQPIDDSQKIVCNWQTAGEAFDSIRRSDGCNITISVSSQPGQGVLTLLANQKFCPQQSVFAIFVQVDDN